MNMVITLAANILKTPAHDHDNNLRHEHAINPNQ